MNNERQTTRQHLPETHAETVGVSTLRLHFVQHLWSHVEHGALDVVSDDGSARVALTRHAKVSHFDAVFGERLLFARNKKKLLCCDEEWRWFLVKIKREKL